MAHQQSAVKRRRKAWTPITRIDCYKKKIDPERRKKWLDNIQRENLSEYAMICENHFTEDQFENRKDRKVLRWNAVPNVFNFANQDSKKSLKRKRITINEENIADIASINVEHSKEFQELIKSLEEKLETANKTIQTLKNENEQLLKNLKKIFQPEQIRSLKKGFSNCTKWSEQTVRKALKLYLTCGSNGYEEIRKQNYPFPSIRTLQRRLQFFKCMPEIHDQIFKLLEIKVDCLLPEEKHAVLMIDEIAIKPGLQFDNSSGEVIGKPTLKNSGDKDSDEYQVTLLCLCWPA
ncbi:hypothetical protein Zmor_027833 [Zophobas morio]|uniref:THAP-type domain-containing protein n=1 Tax=Zophobas morio TaxID=2755281 RepID=A0AA38HQQ2_9CUCU|nr:hypothetical protein Zmor_027833 [Zophobas morio]